jgi:hypothetical protein
MESSSQSLASQSQDLLQDLSVSGYYLHFKSPHSSWEERQVSGQQSSYTFSDLLCGTYYQFYVIAYNAIGKGDPSQVVAVKTKGGRESHNIHKHYFFLSLKKRTVFFVSASSLSWDVNVFLSFLSFWFLSVASVDWLCRYSNLLPRVEKVAQERKRGMTSVITSLPLSSSLTARE